MTDLTKTIDMPDGWIENPKTKEVKPTSLPVGLWVKTLKTLGNKLRFNLITLAPELNGVPFQPDDLDTLYCHLGERGYSITEKDAKIHNLSYALKDKLILSSSP